MKLAHLSVKQRAVGLLAGLALIVVGVLVLTKFDDFFTFFSTEQIVAATSLMVVGGIVFTIGFFGCCGAYKEHYCIVMTFAVILGAVFFLEVASVVAAFILKDELERIIIQHLREDMANYSVSDDIRTAFDSAHINFNCCGAANYTDWSLVEALHNTSSVPDSCCMDDRQLDDSDVHIGVTPGCGRNVLSKPDGLQGIRAKGCVPAMFEWIADNAPLIGGSSVLLASIQVTGIVVSCGLAASIKKAYTLLHRVCVNDSPS